MERKSIMKKFFHVLAVASVASMTLASMQVPAEARSPGYCKSYARQQANRRAGARDVVGGAIGGAVVGGLIGAVVGGHHAVGRGALIGAGVGGVSGGVVGSDRWHRIYNAAYADCRSW